MVVYEISKDLKGSIIAVNTGYLSGLVIAKGAPSITHLMFADDCFFFFKANEGETRLLRDILKDYAEATGQKLSFEKSSLTFSKNTLREDKEYIGHILGVQRGDISGRYLGLPYTIGRNKCEILGFLKDRIVTRIKSWNNRFLSRAGREVLLKNVIQALPSYAMMVFLLPKKTCNEIETIMNGYWWTGSNEGRKGIHWKTWQALANPKTMGGMGFRKLRESNLSLFGKQAWRLITMPDTLVSRVFKAKYYPNSTFVEAKLGSNPSFIWRSILETQDIIKKGSKWIVGSGETINVWKDPWLPDEVNPYVETIMPPYLEHGKVKGLMTENQQSWDVDCVKDVLRERDANLVMNIPLSSRPKNDIISWRWEEKGMYLVKSCYRNIIAHEIDQGDLTWTKMWNLRLPPKVKSFFWQMCTNCLPTAEKLIVRGIQMDGCCLLCRREGETGKHLFMNCSVSKECWRINRCGILFSTNVSLNEWINANATNLSVDNFCNMILICWIIWKGRNEKCWNNITFNPSNVVNMAASYLQNWKKATDHGGVKTTSRSVDEFSWSKPQEGRFKLNTDASVISGTSRMGLGWILRDSNGNFVGAKGVPWCGSFQVKEAEALCIREALSWLKDMEIDNVDIETDAQQVVYALNNDSISTSFGFIVSDIKKAFENFTSISFGFVKRSANQAAHLVARQAVSMSDPSEWHVIPPSFLYDVISADLMN